MSLIFTALKYCTYTIILKFFVIRDITNRSKLYMYIDICMYNTFSLHYLQLVDILFITLSSLSYNSYF